ncbi:unnamed protein product, partial [Rotaria magnacalcarata]
QSHAEGNLTSPKTSMSASHTGNTVTASSTTTAAAKAHTTAATSTGHGHASHAAPWEGVNLWRTPFKGDTDTITQ